ncbi:ATP-binding cassette domain-containing protein [Microbacterium sp. W1N]|uniref:ATP-binding cassette domain-containing protein n=1 Tax=Microbacterium festucae TaxID=2977531 RepID=UPI0021C1C7EF|nr:ATP-binding cassette domain-containing protein [Microbacterium festucae]MCT9820970.1 ATP-binding cassette domain-containing protein [Microbacterium festucae]
MSDDVLVSVSGARKTYPVRNAWGRVTGHLDAVAGVDLDVRAGETLGVVGESGSGKSTLGRLILQVEKPTAGEIVFADDVPGALARRMQVIYQDPFSSLNPHRTALQNVLEPLQVAADLDAAAALERARESLAAVGIEGDAVHKRPRAFSGGQRQRIAIARAIAPRPTFIVCDEPVSALDMQVQAQVTELLQKLQREFGLTYLFISHDLSVVREIATRTAVMRRGRIVELAPTAALFDDPRHPYTQRLLEAVLVPDPARARERLAQIATRPAEDADTGAPERPLVEVAPAHFVAL